MKHFSPITRPLNNILNSSKNTDLQIKSSDWHLYKSSNNKYFMLAIPSGLFAEISEDAYESLSNNKIINNEIKDEVKTLYKLGFFNEKKSIPDEWLYINTVNINLSHQCNLHCRYCFADGGTYGTDQSVMTFETAKHIIDSTIDRSPTAKYFNFILFGGEPLTEMDLVFKIIDYCKEKSKDFGIIIEYDIFTNGLLVTEPLIKRFENDNNLRFLISIDGPPSINDYYRPDISGQPMTDKVADSIKKLTGIDSKRIVIRSTVASKKADIVKRSEYFMSLGAVNLVFEPAYCKDVDGIDQAKYIYKGIEKELSEIGDYLIKKIEDGWKININLLSSTISDILKNQKGAGVGYLSSCPAGKTYISIDTKGDIYPCHYLNCNNQFNMGNIYNSKLIHKDLLSENGIHNLNSQHSICKNCIYRAICSGLCVFKNLVIYPDDIETQNAFCELTDSKVKESLCVLSKFYSNKNYPYSKEWETIYNAADNV